MQNAPASADGGPDAQTLYLDVADLEQSETYQVMPDLTAGEYDALKADIRENDVRTPIVADAESVVIDGHHRVRACRELGIEEVLTRVVADMTTDEKIDLAWRLNMQRRHLDDEEKRERITDYFLSLEEREIRESDAAIAETLGVSETWVRETRHDLVESGKIGTGADFTTQQSVRERIAEALDEDPDASNRSVADEVGTSHPTVGKVRQGGAAARRQRPRVFRHRPYLDSRAQEYLNQSARRIAQREPEWVEDPLDPSVAECLRELREHDADAPDRERPRPSDDIGARATGDTENGNGSENDDGEGDGMDTRPPADTDTDAGDADTGTSTSTDADTRLLLDLLAAGLDYQEVVYWILYEYDGLGPVEVFHATAGKQKSYSHDLDRHAIRNVERVLASAAKKLDAEVDLERSAYMYDPNDATGDDESTDSDARS